MYLYEWFLSSEKSGKQDLYKKRNKSNHGEKANSHVNVVNSTYGN
jgi:hypothetical protein